MSGRIHATARRLGFAGFAGGLCLAASAARAADATWNGATTDWNTANNWAPNAVPTGTATFSNTGSTTVDNASGNVTIGAISFTASPNAQAYTINIDNTFTINGAGITNSSTNTQIFNVNATLNFSNSATAGSASITTNSGGSTNFAGSSSGGSAAFVVHTGGILDFSQLTNGGTTAGSIAGGGSIFLGHNTLTVGSLDTSTTFSGQILDGGLGAGIGGSLDKVGTGTLTLSNSANLYAGATTVDGGTLSVTGAIPFSSGVTINSGGTLDGTGSVPAITVNAGGTLMPGLPGTVGTLTGASVTFNSGATYQVFISGATNSTTQLTGAALLNSGASVTVARGSSVIVGDKYTILTATGGVTGTFNPTLTFGMFKGALTYDTDDAFVTFAIIRLTSLVPAGAPQNAANVANAIDNFTSNGGTLPAGFQNLFNLPPAQLVNGLEQLSGEAATGAQGASFQLTNSFLALLTGPTGSTGDGGSPAMPFAPERADAFPPDVALAYASALKAPVYKAPAAYEPRWTTWGAAFGGGSTTNGDPAGAGTNSVSAHTGAFAAGIDYHVAPDTILGVALAGGGVNWSLGAGLGGGRGDTFLAGLYGSKQSGQAYVSGALTFSSNWMSTSRSIAVAGPDTLTASFNAQDFGGRLEGGYRIPAAMPFNVTPYAAVQAQTFHSPAYGETGTLGAPDPFALTFNAQSATVVRTELGSRSDKMFALADAGTVNLFGRLAWAHDWQSNPSLTATFIGLPTATFVVNGAAPPSDLALVTAGAEWRWRNGWSAMAKFDGELASRSQTYSGTGQIKYSW